MRWCEMGSPTAIFW